MKPSGKHLTEQLIAGINGIVLTNIPDGEDIRYVDVIAPCPPADILNALERGADTRGVMHHTGDVLLPDQPALVVLGIGELALNDKPDDHRAGVWEPEEYVLITLEDLATGLADYQA